MHVAPIPSNPRDDDDDISVISEASDMNSTREDESVASFSIGDYVLRFQKYFSRQLSNRKQGSRTTTWSPNKCGVDDLISGLSKDSEV